MSGSVRPAVEAIWAAMGFAPPPEAIGSRHDFFIDEVPVVLRLARNGRTVELEGLLGTLATDPMRAADQLRRLLRIGLGLAGFNRAGLWLPAGQQGDVMDALARRRPLPDGHPGLEVMAVARIGEDVRNDALRAVQDVVQWHHYARPLLDGQAAAVAPMEPQGIGAADEGMVIFQP